MVTISGEKRKLDEIKQALLHYMKTQDDYFGCEPACRRADKADDPNWTCEDCYQEYIEEEYNWIDTTETPIRGTNYKIISTKTPI